MKKTSLFIFGLSFALLASCGNASSSAQSSQPAATSEKAQFTFNYWSDCNALTKLKTFVDKATEENGSDFIEVADRIAVFDMDGTLYGELYPTYFEYVMYQYRVLEDPKYKDKASDEQILFAEEIKAGVMKDSEGRDVVTAGNSYPSGTDMRHARLAAQAYAGMSISEFDAYCNAFFEKQVPTFNNMKYGDAFYKPMKEVVNFLHENDFTVYVVSGSDRFICRNLCCDALGIPSDHIIGMDVRLEATNQGDTEGVSYQLQDGDDILRTDDLIIRNLKFNKVAQIVKEIGKQPVLSFGNSSGDQSMHKYTITDNEHMSAAFMLVADDADRDYAVLSKAEGLADKWASMGFEPVSMKNDFKTIYGENVTKKLVA